MKVGNTNGNGRYHIQAEINMIPLIDVALVLLIIFMVISPILVRSQLNVKLPKVSKASQSDESSIKVEIDAEGRFSVQGKVTPKENLSRALGYQLPEGHEASVLIQADKEVAFDEVVYVMDLAKQLKVQKLGVAVLPR